MRQRKLLLPPFHGEAIERYAETIAEAADKEIDALAARRALLDGARGCRRSPST